MTATPTPYEVMFWAGMLPLAGLALAFAFHELDLRERLWICAGTAVWCGIYVGALHLLAVPR